MTARQRELTSKDPGLTPLTPTTWPARLAGLAAERKHKMAVANGSLLSSGMGVEERLSGESLTCPITNQGLIVVVVIFQFINWVIKTVGPPKSLRDDEWKWRNLTRYKAAFSGSATGRPSTCGINSQDYSIIPLSLHFPLLSSLSTNFSYKSSDRSPPKVSQSWKAEMRWVR